ncbi:Calnexin precursor family protein [Hibiscus syriacus]|uniref:Calnexin family protein n=1 Tax=Hibiscus syriacus TaxID=106335 RepID=A0A6A3B9J5_HIBSY|nr:uncharacterized protein LOC120115781 [Hibiscus syriacus]KAE8711862.1 Calnexin precursor family protein [Hibiscus syriacus]
MAFRSTVCLKQLANHLRGRATYATSTPPRLKSYAPTADHFGHSQDVKPPKRKGDYVAIYVAVGMIALATTLGVHTVVQQLKNSPQVRVNKKRRESLPEVEEPERVLDEADKFVKQSFFRKVAHVQKNDDDYAIDDPTRADMFADKPKYRVESLKSVGVDPKLRV